SPLATCMGVTPVPGSGAPSTKGTPLAGAVFLAAVASTVGAGSSPSASADEDTLPAPASRSPARAVAVATDLDRSAPAGGSVLPAWTDSASRLMPAARVADLLFAQPGACPVFSTPGEDLRWDEAPA